MEIDPELHEMLKKCRAERKRLREIGGVAPVTMNTLSAVILCLEALCEKIPATPQPCGVPSPEYPSY